MNPDLHNLHTPPPAPPQPAQDECQAAGTNGHGGEHKPARKAKRRRAKRIRTAVAFHGNKLIKLRPVATVGGLVLDAGAWRIGHGKLVVSGENAMDAIAHLDEAIKGLLGQGGACDPREIVALMRLRLEYNRQLLDIGKAQIQAADPPIGAAS